MREAPLAVVSADYRRRMAEQDLDAVLRHLEGGKLHSSIHGLEQRLGELDAEVLRDVAEWRRELVELRETCGPGGLIRNDSVKHQSKVVHRVAVDGFGVSNKAWRTKCGWRFGGSAFTRVTRLPVLWTDICKSCLPNERKSAKLAVGAQSDDES